MRARQILKLAIAPFWLPAATTLVFVVVFGRLPTIKRSVLSSLGEERLPRAGEAVPVAQEVIPNNLLAMAAVFVFAWLGAVPLTAGIYRLHEHSRVLAYVCAALLAPLTVVALIGALDWPAEFRGFLSFSVIIVRLPPGTWSSELGFSLLNLPGMLLALPSEAPGLAHYAYRFAVMALPVALPAWAALTIIASVQSVHSNSEQSTAEKRVLRAAVLSCWLPSVTVAYVLTSDVLSYAEFSNTSWFVVTLVLPTWLAAIPLTVAVYHIYGRSRALAGACAVVLGILTVFLTPAGGLVGAFGVVICGIVGSIPAWIVLGVISYRQRSRITTTPSLVS